MKKKISMFVAVSLVILLTGNQLAFAQEPQPPSGQPVVRITQVDTSQFPQVVVYVSITDANGEPVEVPVSQLQLKENGQVIQPDHIGGAGEIGPLSTILVIDISGSMNHGGKLQAAKDAARAYVDQARPGDLIGIISFNTRIEIVQPLTNDRSALRKAIKGLKARDDTAMYDAIDRAMELLTGVEGRRAIIVLTDGLDNRSKISPQEILQSIDPQGLSISTIGLGDPTQSKSSLGSLDEGALKALAEQAGGVYGYAEDKHSLTALYELYGRALQSEYVITYTSPSTLRDGVNRGLEVSLKNSDAKGAALLEQSSYNPGGLVPEVAQPAPWGVFLIVLAGLGLLILIPFAYQRIKTGAQGNSKPGGRIKIAQPASKAAGKVKLKD